MPAAAEQDHIRRGRSSLRTRRLANRREGWTHASSYVGFSPAAFVHRARLRRLRSLIATLHLPAEGTFLDLGCSDGFVVASLIDHHDLPGGWSFVGYDRSEKMLAAARKRGVPGAQFERRDLNRPADMPPHVGDVTSCLETLEHVGDLEAALTSIDVAMRPGGTLILSMPNEVGLIGFVKLLSRPLLRSAPYRGVFAGKRDFWTYALRVITGQDISYIRAEARKSWGPHVGFDHRRARRLIDDNYVRAGRWSVDREARSAFGANVFMVVRKALPRNSATGTEPVVQLVDQVRDGDTEGGAHLP